MAAAAVAGVVSDGHACLHGEEDAVAWEQGMETGFRSLAEMFRINSSREKKEKVANSKKGEVETRA